MLFIRIHVDLMRILTITSYFSIRNILAKLGGYKALIDPLIGMFIPFFVLSYLHKLARIIKQRRMKEYLNQVKSVCFPMYRAMNKDVVLKDKIVAHHPSNDEKLKVMMWNFIKLTFKYALVKKLEYNMDAFDDIESFYDELYVFYLMKFGIMPQATAVPKNENGTDNTLKLNDDTIQILTARSEFEEPFFEED